MLKRVVLVGAFLAFAGPALADSCGTAPIPPEIPTANAISGKTTDDAHAIVLGAFKNVKTYQGQLSPYRECLLTSARAQKQAQVDANAAGDKAKAEAAKAQEASLEAANDKTVDTETQIANDFNNLHNAYCKMGDGLAGCAKK